MSGPVRIPWLLDRPAELPFMDPRRAHPPGIGPVEMADLIVTGPDYAAQMAERERLLAGERETVLRCLPDAASAASEMLDFVLENLSGRSDFTVADDRVMRPDGATVTLDRADPLATIGRLVAEDVCLMLPGEGEMRLGGAVLCFPSRWLLAEKIGLPLTDIHAPVPVYDETLARRVARLFDNVREGRPLVRVNWLIHTTAQLFLPMASDAKQGVWASDDGPLYLRTERQSLVRLPESGAVAFVIRTQVSELASLSAEERETLASELAALESDDVAYRGGAALRDRAVKFLT